MEKYAYENVKPFYIIQLIILTGVFIWSAIKPANGWMWFYETSFALLGTIVLIWTYRRFPLTPITYFFLWIAFMIMAVGGHYTYQGVPLFNYIKDAWHLSRNHFDRVGHAFQGVVTFLFIREVFFRKNVVKKQWVSLIALGLAFALSASYELIEFVPVYLIKGDVENFLGLQGDRWDSLWDMFWALTGALLILIFFRKTHNRQIARIEKIKTTKNPA